MSKPRDVSVSLYDAGDDTLRVWCASFTIKGSLPQGKDREAAIKRKQKQIERLLATIEIPEE